MIETKGNEVWVNYSYLVDGKMPIKAVYAMKGWMEPADWMRGWVTSKGGDGSTVDLFSVRLVGMEEGEEVGSLVEVDFTDDIEHEITYGQDEDLTTAIVRRVEWIVFGSNEEDYYA